jgi:4,5-dihydroxyphthalate decarboxylase
MLFPDFTATEKYYKEHGIFPIMHLVVARRELYEKYPFIMSSLYEAFDKPKIVGLGRAKQLS